MTGLSAAIGLEILEIGFDHRVHVAHLRHEEVLALHDAVDNVVEGQSGRSSFLCDRGAGSIARSRRLGRRGILSHGRENASHNYNEQQSQAKLNTHRNLLGVDHANWKMI